MKIVVCSDLHGNTTSADDVVRVAEREKPNKLVVCGDVLGSNNERNTYIEDKLLSIDCVLYVIKGNNDYASVSSRLPFEDNAVMYHFGRTLFFTHGHNYNYLRLPPVIHENDVFVYGHTHTGFLRKFEGIFIGNVGSMALPRNTVSNYLVLDDNGMTLKDLDGHTLSTLLW